MINIKPHDFIFFQDLSTATTTIVFIFRGCDQNTKLDSRMNNFFYFFKKLFSSTALHGIKEKSC